MKTKYRVSGKEKFLSETFFKPRYDFDPGMFSFARTALLQRVLWNYLPEGYHCHLDGFDFDELSEFEDGFFGVGRVLLLDETTNVCGIYASMAAKFEGVPKKLVSAKIWVSKMPVVKGQCPDHMQIVNLSKTLQSYEVFGTDWSLALYRSASGWKKTAEFDPSIFFSVDKDEPNEIAP